MRVFKMAIVYYLGIIIGALLATWVGQWDYTLVLIFLSSLMVLIELLLFGDGAFGRTFKWNIANVEAD